MAQEQTKTELSEIIAENFGANATYVESLFARFRSDPSLVDESWRAYFEELIGNGQPAETAVQTPAKTVEQTKPSGDGSTAATAPAKKSEPAATSATLEPGKEI
ncbi:MAG TPA: hypothetical protein VGW32_05500, partial [Pyrinomonadaceae bacterium]|nr:hypothetical protein [Pyrinomonadaceae bacterium]